MLVADVMTADLVTCESDATLAEAGKRMLAERVGSVVVTADGEPRGIVTETDLVRAGVERDGPFSAVEVTDVMREPLESVAPSATLQTAVRRMRDAEVKKLLVRDGMEAVGILTRSDVALSAPAIQREASDAAEQGADWAHGG